MADEIDEVLKFDPGRPAVNDAEIDEVLKFDPVGGTYGPKEPPFKGAGSPISTITGKPELEFKQGEDPGAKKWTLIKSGFVDDPAAKIKIFAKDRGIDPKRYRINNGNIEFLNSANKWQREESELPIDRLGSGIIKGVTNPGAILGTVGAMGGPIGAVAGAVGGEGIRKGIGGAVLGEEQTTLGNLVDVGLEGLLAAGGELFGALNKGVAQGIKSKIAKITGGKGADYIKYAGAEVGTNLLTKEDHLKALMIQDLASKYGIKLAPHQLYKKEGMINTWMYLRKSPATADAIQKFEEAIATSSDKAIDDFITQLGGFEKSPHTLGEAVSKTTQKAIGNAEEARAASTSPLYKSAREGARASGIKVDTSGATKVIDELLNETVKGDPSYSALNRIKGMIEEAGGDLGKLDRVKRSGIDDILKASKTNTLNREMMLVKDKLTSAMDSISPEYAAARKKYAEMSSPIDRLNESVVGQISRIQSDKGITEVPKMLFDVKDAKLLREAKSVIEKEDPKIWQELVGGYIRDTYETLRVSESGDVINAVGKLNKKLYGTERQRQIMNAALGDNTEEAQAFKDLMTVFQRAAVGTKSQSMTHQFGEIAEGIGKIPGSKIYRYAMSPRQAVVESLFSSWNDILLKGKQEKLLSALTSPKSLQLIKNAKRLQPGSKRLIETASVLTTLVGKEVGVELNNSETKQ